MKNCMPPSPLLSSLLPFFEAPRLPLSSLPPSSGGKLPPLPLPFGGQRERLDCGLDGWMDGWWDRKRERKRGEQLLPSERRRG